MSDHRDTYRAQDAAEELAERVLEISAEHEVSIRGLLDALSELEEEGFFEAARHERGEV